ncbi:MAG TPA: hypothetical protein VL949_13000 [Geobacteraceae bacterium]|jgi:hypothetical protein|nr:hypothetical protein [Geobacteraceae bacterium]
MGKHAVRFLLLLAVLSFPHVAKASMIKAYFSDFAVTGPQRGEEMQRGLKALLASRLGDALILSVDTPAEADILVSGSYVEFGAVFSMDAVAKNSTGAFLARAFVQGEGKGELIPSLEMLARDLADQVRKAYPPPSAPQAASSSPR